jgi:hypothetical protein
MVPKERLIKQDEERERQGVRTQEAEKSKKKLRKTYLEFFPKRSSTSYQDSLGRSQLQQAMGGVKFPHHVII